jgi:hypothetical protein
VIFEPQPHNHDGHEDSLIPGDSFRVRVTVQAPTSTDMGDEPTGWAGSEATAPSQVNPWR